MLTLLEDFVKVYGSFLKANGNYNNECFVAGSCFKNYHDYHPLLPLNDTLAKVAEIMTKNKQELAWSKWSK